MGYTEREECVVINEVENLGQGRKNQGSVRIK